MAARGALGATHWKTLVGKNKPPVSDAFRPNLQCPDDDAPLDYLEHERNFHCPSCSRIYTPDEFYLSLRPSNDYYQLSDKRLDKLTEQVKTDNRFVESPQNEFPSTWALVESILPSFAGKKVLDLCCGHGWAAAYFAKCHAEVAALDIVAGDGGLRSAHEHCKSLDNPPDFFQGDVCRLPFQSGLFDVVFTSSVIHQIPRPERLLKEISRTLADGGVYIAINEETQQGRLVQSTRASSADPRDRGRKMSHADFKALFKEGFLDLEVLIDQSDMQQNLHSRSFLGRIKKSWRNHTTNEPRVMLGRHQKEFDFSKLNLMRKREAK